LSALTYKAEESINYIGYRPLDNITQPIEIKNSIKRYDYIKALFKPYRAVEATR